MYAYKELKKQLDGVDEFRFIFTSPTFIKDRETKEKREFYIPRMNRESSLYGTEFEIKLRNEMTQKAVAKECAEKQAAAIDTLLPFEIVAAISSRAIFEILSSIHDLAPCKQSLHGKQGKSRKSDEK